MYDIYGNIYHQYTPNVSIYIPYMDPMGYIINNIHGAVGRGTINLGKSSEYFLSRARALTALQDFGGLNQSPVTMGV